MQEAILFQRILHKTEHKTSNLIIIPPPKHWTGGSMLLILQTFVKICADTATDPQIALVQIRTNPLGQGLPTPGTPLFNHPMRGNI